MKNIKGISLLAAMGLSVCCYAEKRPNIILVLADDLGYGDVSALNPESKIATPNIDALAKCGITFTDAHATSSVSTPSRYSILTGRYSWRTPLKQGVFFGYSAPLINQGRETLGSMLSKSGYNTACIGKWHLGWDWAFKEGSAKRQDVDFSKPVKNGVISRGGFDYFFGIAASLDMPPYVYVENEMPTALPDSVTENRTGVELFRSGPIASDFEPAECLNNFFKRSMSFVGEQKENDKPFFLYMPLTAPHTPCLPSVKYRGKTSLGPYGDFVVMVDDLLGELVDTLKASGQWENTIFVFTSDNGCAPSIDIPSLQNRGHNPSYIFRGAKTDIYDGGHRIPLIVTWGDRFNSIRDNSLVSLSDFYATFAQVAGHKLSDTEAEDSFSIINILERAGGSSRKDLISLSGNGHLALRVPEIKLIFSSGSGGKSFPNEPKDLVDLPDMQLYDMNIDVAERKNMINDPKYAEIVEELTTRMRGYVDNGRTTPGKAQKNDTENNWKQTKLF